MSMSDGERGELVKLWGEIPGCKPEGIIVKDGKFYDERFLHAYMDRFVAALARDAIVEWLKLTKGDDGLNLTVCEWEGMCHDGVYRAQVDLVEACGSYDHLTKFMGRGPTRLSALIAAARAVGGKG